MTKLCNCGSGLPRYDLVDAAGNFCAFVCGICEDDKRANFDPRIFDHRSVYAATGEEDDLQ